MATADVTFKRVEYIAHEGQIELCNAIYGGIDTAKDLIIQNPNEYTEDFNNRVKRATLDNYVERIVSTMGGEIFRKPLTFEDTPDAIVESMNRINKTQSLAQFAKQLVEKSILNGKAFVLVDTPVEGGDPYLSMYDRSQLHNWRVDENGLFTLVVLAEYYAEEDGQFGIEHKLQYRVLDAQGNVQIWRAGDESKSQWQVVEEIITSYDFCPFFELSVSDIPPLYDIATINKNHINFSSSQDDYLLEALTPMLFGKALGMDGENDLAYSSNDTKPATPKMVIGVRSANFADNAEASMEWIEMSGQTYDISSRNLLKKEEDMAVRALRLQNETVSNKTATQSTQENTEKQSRLTDIATDAQITINNSLEAWSMMKSNKPFEGVVVINKDFNNTSSDSNLLSGLNALQMAGNLSKETLLKSLIKAEIIDVESIEEEMDRIEAEVVTMPDEDEGNGRV